MKFIVKAKVKSLLVYEVEAENELQAIKEIEKNQGESDNIKLLGWAEPWEADFFSIGKLEVKTIEEKQEDKRYTI